MLLACAALACRIDPTEPQPTAVVPGHGPAGAAVHVVIEGTDLLPRAVTDFTAGSESTLDGRFTARLGPSFLGDVLLAADGTLHATVPAELPAGVHDLTVTRPDGRAGTLRAAYRALGPADDAAGLVAAFRVDPVGDQQAFRPFLVTVSAVDARGDVVAEFAGSATLADETGALVAARAGPFERGRWTGPVEVRAGVPRDTVTATDAAGRTGRSDPFTVVPSPAVAVAFATPARDAVAGGCSDAISAVLLDLFGAPTQAPARLRLGLAAGAAELFADAACTVPLEPTLAPFTGALTFHARSRRAGSFTVSAAASGLAATAQPLRIAAGPPAQVAFVTARQTVEAGACGAATVEIQDAFGNPVEAPGAVLAVAADPPDRLAFFADERCTTPLAGAVADAEGRATVHFSGTLAAPVTVTALGSGLAAAAQEEVVVPEAHAARFAFVTPPRSAASGACSAPVSVQAQDSYGNPVAGDGAVQAALASSPAGVLFFADAACSVPATGITIGPGAAAAQAYFRALDAGAYTLTASGALTAADQPAAVVGGAPARLAFATPAPHPVAGACSGRLDVSVEDAAGNRTTLPAAATVAISATPATGVTFYADASCAVALPGAALPLPAGASGASFSYAATVAGSVALTASLPGSADARLDDVVRGGPPARLAFPDRPRSAPAGGCSAAVAIELRDLYGNPATAAAPTTVTLSAAPSGLRLYASAGCGAPASSISIATGDAHAAFFFQADGAGNYSVAASSPSLGAASQLASVAAGAPDRLAFASAPPSLVTGACSGAITVESRDAQGNPSPVAADAPVTLAASPAATFAFYADALCTTPASPVLASGRASVQFHVSGRTAGAVDVAASATGLAATHQSVTVRPGPAARLVLAALPLAVNAGACRGGLVQARDVAGNAAPVAAAVTVALGSVPVAGLHLFSDQDCLHPASSVSIPTGAAQAAFWMSGSVPQPVSLSAAAPGFAPDATADVWVVATGVPTAVAFAAPPPAVVAGACSAAVAVALRDGAGPVNAPSAIDVALAVSPAGAVAFYADPGCNVAVTEVTILSGAPSASFHLLGTAAGPFTMRASAGAAGEGSQDAAVAPAPADRLTLATPPATAVAGSCSGPLALEPRDPYGNASPLASAADVALTVAPGTGVELHATPDCSGPPANEVRLEAGQPAAALSFVATAAGAFTLGGSADGLVAVPQTEVVIPGAAARLAFATPPRTVPAGACSAALTLEARDPVGNAAPIAAGADVALSAPGLTVHAGAGCGGQPTAALRIPPGASSATFSYTGSSAGTFTIGASAPGLGAPAVQDAAVSPGAPAALALVGGPQRTSAGACSGPVRIELRDASGNPAPAAAALSVGLAAAPAETSAFQADPACTTPLLAAAIAAGQSSSSAVYFRGTAAGPVTLSASAGALAPASEVEDVTPGPVAALLWDPIPSPQAAGVPFAAVLRAVDAWSNLVPSFAGRATLSSIGAPVSCASVCAGASTGDFVQGVWSGSVAVGVPTGGPVAVVAAAPGGSGTSRAFVVEAPPVRSPPLVRLAAAPAVVLAGSSVALDASGSADAQTLRALLDASFAPSAVASPPPGAPWSAFSRSLAGSVVYDTPGVQRPVAAVRDADGDLGYGSAVVVVVADAAELCLVDTATDLDDGATGCGAGALGADGHLSLREAVRVAGARAGTTTIAFAPGVASITGEGAPLDLSGSIRLVGSRAGAGLTLDGLGLRVAAGADALVAGLTLARAPIPLDVAAGATVALEDVTFRQGSTVTVSGTAALVAVDMAACGDACLRVVDPTAQVTVTGSTLRETAGPPAGATGIRVEACDALRPSLALRATVLAGFETALDVRCAGPVDVQYDTFHGNGTAVALAGGDGHLLGGIAFTAQGVTALRAGAAAVAYGAPLVLFRNASDGDAASAPGSLHADPAYCWPAAGDFRLQPQSRAVDAGGATSLDLTGAAPGSWLGAAPDLGGRETY